MPIPEEKLYPPGKLHKWFAVSSVLMTLSVLWMIAVDFDRPWIQFQDSYFVSKAALAHLEFLDATRQERTNELAEAKQRFADAKQLDDQVNHARRETILGGVAEADLEFRKVNPLWSQGIQVLQVTSDTYERILGEFGSEHPKTKQAREQLESEKNEVAEFQKQKEHFQDRKRELQVELKRMDEGIRSSEKQVRDLEQRVESAQQKDRDFRGVLTDEGLLGGLPIVKWVISAPLLDFTAPKTTPVRRQVHQLVLPQIRQQLNYLESYTTDRCTTCHVAIDDPEFSQERLAGRLEQALPGINEELQRRGKQPYELPTPPTLDDASAPKLPAGQVTEHWKELSPEQRDQYFETLQKFVNRYLDETGRKKIELGQPLLAHPDLDLYVAVDSPHPKKEMGCSVCHEGNSQETDFVLAAHSPPTHKTEEAWKEEYYVTALGVPNITFETVAHYWDRPMLLPQHTQAGCAKCHTNVADIDRFEGRREGEMINQGRHLYRTLGCINCHEVKALAGARKVGPDLSRVSAKLTPEFVQQWAFFPQKFRPSTHMPHLFLQENNSAESANSHDTKPILRTETEVAAISKYLFAVSDDQWKPLAVPEGVTGDVERGKALFRQVGCTACHANLTEFGEEWITADLT
ncbi:MAG: hypothetical protein AABZ47_01580, partial [Planctomycetota bacterium]